MQGVEFTKEEKDRVLKSLDLIADMKTEIALIKQYIKSRTDKTRFIVPTIISIVSVICCLYVTFIK